MALKLVSYTLFVCLLSIARPAAATDLETDERLPSASRLPQYATILDGRLNKHEIAVFEAVWGLFVVAVAQENKQATAGRRMLEGSLGLSRERSDALLRYMRTAVDDVRVLAVESTEKTCRQRGGLAGRTVLAQHLEQADRELDRAREERVENLNQVLNPAEEASLIRWVDQNLRQNMQSMVFDYDVYLATENVHPTAVLNRLCTRRTSSEVK